MLLAFRMFLSPPTSNYVKKLVLFWTEELGYCDAPALRKLLWDTICARQAPCPAECHNSFLRDRVRTCSMGVH